MERPTKRVRVYRKRENHDDNDDSEIFREETTQADNVEQSLVRQRKVQKRGRSGITFNNDRNLRRSLSQDAEQSPGIEDAATAVQPSASINRFTHETGQRVDDGTDKHIVAYIDFKLAQLRQDEEDAQANTSGPQLSLSPADTTLRERIPATSGRLQEIDLGPSAQERNIQRTELARQRLEGGSNEEPDGTKPRRVRIGRDGKPMKPRKRFRRRSEDVERDKLIDSLMKEARLEVYEKPEETVNGTGDDEAADERIAEAFRRDFMNQVEDKNVRKGPPPPPGPARGAKGEPEMKGPKLGGSRSARAAMRAQQEASKKH